MGVKYFSMFSGVGGFEYGIQRAFDNRPDIRNGAKDLPDDSTNTQESQVRAECVGYSEIDKYAIETYEHNWKGHINYGDATKINERELPDFDLLVGGFPCQAFSVAGKRLGFNETRGTLFFDIARILSHKRPRHLVLENVKGLLSHDSGKTFQTIVGVLTDLGYVVEWQVLNAKDFGVPQNRERVFIVGHLGTCENLVFPIQYKYDKTYNESMYWLSDELSAHTRQLLLRSEKEKQQGLSATQMQDLLTRVEQEVQQGKSVEVEREPEEVRQKPKGDIQKVEELGAFLESVNDTGTVRGVVCQPTEELLLLWHSGERPKTNTRRLQQQDISANGGQNGLIEKLRTNQHLSLLLAVQPYQGKLFFSIGDGRDWQFIYKQEVEELCKPTLSSILETDVDDKYFLSQDIANRLLQSQGTLAKKIGHADTNK